MRIFIVLSCVISLSPFCVRQVDGQGSMNLTSYKWMDVVLDQIPVVSNSCMKAVGDCYSWYDTFENVLYAYEDKTRRNLCDYTSGQCLDNHVTGKKKSCIPLARHRIKSFLCYKYDSSDNDIPPVSVSCARRYWHCSKMRAPFYDLIPAQHKKELCAKDIPKLCFPWYWRVISPYTWGKVLEIADHICVNNETTVSYYFGYLEHVLKCYGEHFDLFRLMTEFRNLDEQTYICGNQMECLMTSATFKEWNCGLHEARAADEIMCSGTRFTPDKYGLFLVSDECKYSFSMCYNHSVSELMSDPPMRKTLCRTRLQSLDGCLDGSHCSMSQDAIILGNFLCFSPDDPVFLVHDHCIENFRKCFWGIESNEGFSYLEMSNNVHLKSEFCEYEDYSLRTCLKESMGDWYRGCSKNELKIIHDFVCGSCFYEMSCTSNRNNLSPFLGGRLETNGKQYKWLPLVKSQRPNMISETCLKMFRFCFELTFEQLMFQYDDKRRKICKGREEKKCLEHRVPGLGKLCSRLDVFQIRMFLCYDYNVTDTPSPPISIPCMMRYWQCSMARISFLEAIPTPHREVLCNDPTVFQDCRDCMWRQRFQEQTPMVLEYMCNNNLTSARESLSQRSTLCLQECYAINFDIFRVLEGMKYLNEQSYMCGHLEECLVWSNRSGTVDDSIVCEWDEARVVDEFMCSNTTFTPDRHGLFLVSGQCLESFSNNCYRKNISDLKQDSNMRGSLCRERTEYLDSCLDESLCNIEQDAKYLGNFLCFKEDDQILKVTDPCLQRFMYCCDYFSYEGFSYVEMKVNLNIKYHYCADAPTRKCLMIDDFDSETETGCSQNEITIIYQYMCGSCSKATPVTKLVVLLFVCTVNLIRNVGGIFRFV